MKLLIIDNYDSFTYNLVHIIRETGLVKKLDIYRNDKIDLGDIRVYDKILISPGPGIPNEAGILKEVVKEYSESKSILGICLGLQGIAEVFGCQLFNMKEVMHGVASDITVREKEEYLFHGLPHQFKGCHYHSWAVLPETVTEKLKVTATDERENIMGLSHIQYDVKGLQFHPESILTEHGKKILENWIKH